MKGHTVSAPIDKKFFTPGVIILMLFALTGGILALYRLIFGLSSITNLNNQYPMGLWIGVDVASGVALAAGGFTTAALIHIFHRDKYDAIGRPAHLTAMLGYTFVALGLLLDLGRWYNVWHPMLPMFWQGNSVLFEVGICVMLYLIVLYVEFIPVVAERFICVTQGIIDKLLRLADKILDKVMWVFIIMGVLLSCLHQSSLGNLLVIAPYKMHPLWYTPWLPVLFLASAITVGFPMVIFESMIASRSFGKEIEMDVLSPLSKMVPVLLGFYIWMKIIDIFIRDAWMFVFEQSLQSTMFLIEFIVGLLIPFIILIFKRGRKSPLLLFGASTLYILFGVVLNRYNIFVIAYQPPYKVEQYFPTIEEFLVTFGLIATLMLVYRVIVTIFPVLPKHGSHDKSNYIKIDSKTGFSVES